MPSFNESPEYEQVAISCLLSIEQSCSLTSIIPRKLGENVMGVLKKLPTKEWMIAGGFMACVAGHTKCYGDVDVFSAKYVSEEELGDEWRRYSVTGSLYNYGNPNRPNRYVIYNHRTTRVQLIVPINNTKPFQDYYIGVFMEFDIDYCKMGWIGSKNMVMDLRGVKPNKNIYHSKSRELKYQCRLVNKQLPIPRLSVLAYLKCIQCLINKLIL